MNYDNEVFQIGDGVVSASNYVLHHRDEILTALDAIKEGDGAFVRDKGQFGDENWKYAIVVAAEHTASSPNIVFQVSVDGNTWKIERYEWLMRVSPLRRGFIRAGHPKGLDAANAAPFHAISVEDEGKLIALQSITALPVYEHLSFEELRLRDYSENCHGNKWKERFPEILHREIPYKWGGSDLNLYFEVDLTSKRVVLRRPPAGGTGMYTKKQCLHIIKNTTLKSSKERGGLIRFLSDNKVVPNQRALYRLLQRDEKGLLIHDENWGLQCTTRQSNLADIIVWDSDQHDHVRPLPHLTKKRKLIGDEIMAKGEYVRWGLMNERGWKGRIRLRVFAINFVECQNIKKHTEYSSTSLLDICSYIGESDIWRGGQFVSTRYRQSEHRTCRLYFDPKLFPSPKQHSKGGDCPVFEHLKRYICWAAWRDESPVICKSGSSKDEKIFTCNKKYTNRHRKKKKCPFYFQVRWDNYGYYIHLLNDKAQRYNHSCGQGWHCCRQS